MSIEKALKTIVGELKQLVDRPVWEYIHREHMTKSERRNAIRSHMFIKYTKIQNLVASSQTIHNQIQMILLPKGSHLYQLLQHTMMYNTIYAYFLKARI